LAEGKELSKNILFLRAEEEIGYFSAYSFQLLG